MINPIIIRIRPDEEHFAPGQQPQFLNRDEVEKQLDSRHRIKIDVFPSVDHPYAEGYIVSLNDSVLTRWLSGNNANGTCAISIAHPFEKVKLDEYKLQKVQQAIQGQMVEVPDEVKVWVANYYLSSWSINGFTDVETGRHYKLTWMSAGGTRKCESVWTTDLIRDKFIPWYTLGMPILERMPLEKGWLYVAQCESSTRTFRDGLPARAAKAIGTLDVNNVVLVNDVETTRAPHEVDYVHDGIVERISKEITENEIDGAMYVFLSLSEPGVREAIRTGDLDSFTIRAPGFKGLIIFVIVESAEALAREHGLEFAITDIYGNKIVPHHGTIIAPKSAMKWSKAFKTEADWKEYQQKFVELGHEFLVCKTPHIRLRPMPYQQHQVLTSNDSYFANRTINALNNECTAEGAATLLNNTWERKAAAIAPEYLAEPTANDTVLMRHRSNVKAALKGGIPDFLRYTFCAPDTVPVLLAMMGGEPVSLLKENEVHVNLGYEKKDGKRVPVTPYGKRVFMTRNPAPGLNVLFKNNVDIDRKYADLYIGSNIYLSIDSLVMRVLSADFDGDTLGVASEEDEHVRKYFQMWLQAARAYDYRCVCFDNASPKSKYSPEAYSNSVAMAMPSDVGLIVNTITKMWAWGYDHEEECLLECGTTKCIDAAKNGNDPETLATMSRVGELEEKYRKYANPMHLFFGKVLPSITVVDDLDTAIAKCMPRDKYGNPRYVYTGSYLSRYVKTVKDSTLWNVPFDKFNLPVWDLRNSWKLLVNGTYRRLRLNGMSLCVMPEIKAGIPDWSSSEFGQIVCTIEEMKHTIKDRVVLKERLNEYAAFARASLAMFGRLAAGVDEDVVVNSLVCAIYQLKVAPSTANAIKSMKEALWFLYGEKLYRNVCFNKDEKIDVQTYEGDEPEIEDELDIEIDPADCPDEDYFSFAGCDE